MDEIPLREGVPRIYPIDPNPTPYDLPVVKAEEYKIYQLMEPFKPGQLYEFGLFTPKKFAYPCPFCLEPVPPSTMDPAKHYWLCAVCRHLILDHLLTFPRNRYGRKEEMALLCLEAIFIRNWNSIISGKKAKGPKVQAARAEEALSEAVALLLENQSMFVERPGDVEKEVLDFLEAPPPRYGVLAQELRKGRVYREQVEDLLRLGAGLKAITIFQIVLVESTSEAAFKENEKKEILQRLRQRL